MLKQKLTFKEYGLIERVIAKVRKYGLPDEDKTTLEWIEDTLKYDMSLIIEQIKES